MSGARTSWRAGGRAELRDGQVSGPPDPDRARREALAQLARLRERKVLVATLGAAGFGAVAVLMAVAHGHWLFAVASGLLAAMVFRVLRRVGRADYYRLPHSRDAKGKHRCVFCGSDQAPPRSERPAGPSCCPACGELLFCE